MMDENTIKMNQLIQQCISNAIIKIIIKISASRTVNLINTMMHKDEKAFEQLTQPSMAEWRKNYQPIYPTYNLKMTIVYDCIKQTNSTAQSILLNCLQQNYTKYEILNCFYLKQRIPDTDPGERCKAYYQDAMIEAEGKQLVKVFKDDYRKYYQYIRNKTAKQLNTCLKEEEKHQKQKCQDFVRSRSHKLYCIKHPLPNLSIYCREKDKSTTIFEGVDLNAFKLFKQHEFDSFD